MLKVTRNAVFNILGYVWTTGVALLLIPYTVTRLGVEAFGIWSLIFVVTTYLALLDFGLNTALIKYVAEYHTRENQEAINGIVTTGVLIFAGLGVGLTALALVTVRPMLDLFRIPPKNYGDATVVLLGAVACLALTNLSNVFQSVLTGLQRLDWVNLISVIASALSAVTTVAVLELGHGLRGLTAARLIVITFGLVALAVASRRLLPSLRLVPIPRLLLHQLLGYAVRVQITNLASVVHLQSGRVMLGYFVGVAAVTFYELGFRIAYIANSLPLLLLSALTPAAAELDARAQTREEVVALYVRAARYLTLIALPIELLPFVGASLVMRGWMGPGYDAAVPVVQALVLVFLVNLILTGTGTTVARGIGRPGYETRYAILVIGVNLSLGPPLTAWLGLNGTLTTAVLASIAGSAYFLTLFHHEYLRRPVITFLRDIYVRPLAAALIAALGAMAVPLVFQAALKSGWVPETRLTAWAALAIQAGIFLGIYLAGVRLSGYLDERDRGLLITVTHWAISGSRRVVGRLAADWRTQA